MAERDRTESERAVSALDQNMDAVFGADGAGEAFEVPERAPRSDFIETLPEAFKRVGKSLILNGESEDAAFRLEVGVEIRRERLRQGLTQSELADRVGISQAMLSKIETARGAEGPTLKTLYSLVDELGLRLALLPEREKATEQLQAAEISISKPSTGSAARIHVTELSKDGVSFVRSFITNADMKGLRKRFDLRGQNWENKNRNPLNAGKVCLWSFEPYSGTVIKTGNGVVLVVTQDDGNFRLISSTTKGELRKITGKSLNFTHEVRRVEYLGGSQEVVVTNLGAEKSMLLSVPAELLAKRTG